MMLSDVIETEMKGTVLEGELSRLFEGEIESVVQCSNIEFESTSKELFTVLQVPLTESNTIENALRKLLSAEDLTGVDQYECSDHGK
jgi:ubiquitin carboxyl-terminal hydrolase 7